MSTFTAEKFKIAFTAAMLRWYEGGEDGPDPRCEWEYSDAEGGWKQNYRPETPYFTKSMSYRWKQPEKRTVTIDGVELVAPEVGAPAHGAEYYVEASTGLVYSVLWGGRDHDLEALGEARVEGLLHVAALPF